MPEILHKWRGGAQADPLDGHLVSDEAARGVDAVELEVIHLLRTLLLPINGPGVGRQCLNEGCFRPVGIPPEEAQGLGRSPAILRSRAQGPQRRAGFGREAGAATPRGIGSVRAVEPRRPRPPVGRPTGHTHAGRRRSVGIGHVRLDVQNGRAVAQVPPVEIQHVGLHRAQRYQRQPDRVWAVGRAARKHARCATVHARRSRLGLDGFSAVAVEHPQQPDHTRSRAGAAGTIPGCRGVPFLQTKADSTNPIGLMSQSPAVGRLWHAPISGFDTPGGSKSALLNPCSGPCCGVTAAFDNAAASASRRTACSSRLTCFFNVFTSRCSLLISARAASSANLSWTASSGIVRPRRPGASLRSPPSARGSVPSSELRALLSHAARRGTPSDRRGCAPAQSCGCSACRRRVSRGLGPWASTLAAPTRSSPSRGGEVWMSSPTRCRTG
eukprot:scaffold9115_cov115-Isochrysis_galbana.AAC.7